ncbi:hypothetical protein EF297_004980 [Escherichia coli]|nr:hypothetical protein [Escherichia coli]EEW0563752.1 hypothetical protein [Escherichia coli]
MNMDIARKEVDEAFKSYRKLQSSEILASDIISIEKRHNVFVKRDYELLCYYLSKMSLSNIYALVVMREKMNGTFKELDESDRRIKNGR